jgi:hypothetical protein
MSTLGFFHPFCTISPLEILVYRWVAINTADFFVIEHLKSMHHSSYFSLFSKFKQHALIYIPKRSVHPHIFIFPVEFQDVLRISFVIS